MENYYGEEDTGYPVLIVYAWTMNNCFAAVKMWKCGQEITSCVTLRGVRKHLTVTISFQGYTKII